jgi:hypothetical protein
VPGVFAVGDARHGSVKRVASAVGEGSVVIPQVEHYLAETRQRTEPARASGRWGTGAQAVKAVPGEVMLAAPEQRHTALSRRQLGGGAQS